MYLYIYIYIYIYVFIYLFITIGSYDCGGWELPRSAIKKLETQNCQCIVPVQVQRPKNRERQKYKFQSESEQSWDPRRANVSVQIWRHWLGWLSGLRTGLWTKSEGTKRLISQLKSAKQEFPLTLHSCSVGWGPPIPGRAVCFTQSTNSNPGIMFD